MANKVYGYKKQNNCYNNYRPLNLHLTWEDDTYGLYFVRFDSPKVLEKSTDKMATTSTVETRTNANIARGWHDKVNHIIYLVDCDYDGGTSYVYQVDLSDDSITELTSKSGDIFDIWMYSDEVHILYFEKSGYTLETGNISPDGDVVKNWSSTAVDHFTEIDEDPEFPSTADKIYTSVDEAIDEFTMETIDMSGYDSAGVVDQVYQIRCYIYASFGNITGIDIKGNKTGMGTKYILELFTTTKWCSVTWSGLSLDQAELDDIQIEVKANLALGGSVSIHCLYCTVFFYGDDANTNVVIENIDTSDQYSNDMGAFAGRSWDISQISIVGDQFWFNWKWSNENVELWRYDISLANFLEMEDCGATTELPSIEQHAIAYDGSDVLYFVLGTGTAEVSTIVAAAPGTIDDGDYITYSAMEKNAITGVYSEKDYYIWFDKVGDKSGDPAPADKTEIWVDINAAANAQDVSDAIESAVNAVVLITCDNAGGLTCTLTNHYNGNTTNIADVDSGLVVATTVPGVANTYYLYTYAITSDTLTKGPEYNVVLMLNRNTDTTLTPECFALEKGFHLTDMKAYQIPRTYTGTLNYIANWETSLPSATIVAITDTYVIINNSGTYELWEFIDVMNILVPEDFINSQERTRFSNNLTWLKKALYSDPPTKDQFVQIFGRYTSDQLTSSITYVGEESFSGITTTAEYYKGSAGFNYETPEHDELYFGSPDNFNDETLPITGTDIAWVDSASTAANTEIVAEIGDHLKVLQQTNVGATDECGHAMTQATGGTHEFWLRTNDANKHTRFRWMEDVTSCFSFNIIANKFKWWDGGWHDIADALANIWYHIKIIWIAANTYDLYIDGVLELDDQPFESNQVSGINILEFRVSDHTSYIDAFGITADANYDAGDNYFPGNSSTDIEWIDTDTSAPKCINYIHTELDDHKNVLKMVDTNLGVGMNNYIKHNFPSIAPDHIIEFWIATADITQNQQITINIFEGATQCIYLEINQDDFRYRDAGGLNNIKVAFIVNNTFFHVKLELDDSANTFDCYINGVLEGNDLPYRNNSTIGTESIAFHTGNAGAQSVINYLDAFGIVGEVDPEGYTYVESYNINGYDIDELLDEGYVLTCAFGGSYIKTNALVGAHVDVLELFDNQGDIAYGDYVELNIPFSVQTYGTAELFIRSTDTAEYCTIDMLEGTTVKVRLFIHEDKFYINDGAIEEVVAVADNIWYHVRIAFECTGNVYESLAEDHWKIWIDGTEYGDYTFLAGATTNIDSIQFASDAGHSTHIFYIDAVDFSWATGYRKNRNWVKTLDDQVIFEGLVKDYDLNIEREIFVVSQAKELDNISPNITSYANYTGKKSGAIITQLISDYCKYITVGTLSDGAITWTCPTDWEANGDKSLLTIINEFADAEKFSWRLRPTGKLDFDAGTVSTHITLLATDQLKNPFTRVFSQDINQVLVYGGFVDGVPMGPYTANDLPNQQLHGIQTWTKRYASNFNATNLQTLANNKLLLQGSAPLIYRVIREMGATADFGFVQVGETIRIDANTLVVEKDSDEYVTAGDYILNVNDFDVKNDESELKLVDGMLFIEQIRQTLPEQNSQLIQQVSGTLVDVSERVKDVWVPASGIRAPGLKPAEYVSHGIAGVWQFGDEEVANEETISGTVKFREDVDMTVAPTFLIGWSSTTTEADCYWQLEYLFTGLNENTTAAAQETKLLAATSSAVAEGLVVSSFTLQIPAATDKCIHFRIKRRSASAEDTIADTVEVHGVCLSYTADIIGTS